MAATARLQAHAYAWAAAILIKQANAAALKCLDKLLFGASMQRMAIALEILDSTARNAGKGGQARLRPVQQAACGTTLFR